jgi:transposase-like protein
MNNYTHHYTLAGLDEAREHQRQWQEHISQSSSEPFAPTVGTPVTSEVLPDEAVKLTHEERRAIATCKGNIKTVIKRWNVSPSVVRRCREEYEETNGEMIEGTVDFTIVGESHYTLEFKAMVAADKGSPEEVARIHGVSEYSVRSWRKQLARGELATA